MSVKRTVENTDNTVNEAERIYSDNTVEKQTVPNTVVWGVQRSLRELCSETITL